MRLPYRLLVSILLSITVKCVVIEKYSDFNENLREFSSNNLSSSDDIRTLQTEKAVKALFTPSTLPVKYKDASDNALASTSHVKGFTPLSKAGYAVHDYNDHGHENSQEHGHQHGHHGLGYDYFVHEIDHLDGHGHYGYEHGYHYPEHNHHHHHKHYDHALATKAILWPIAGIALLGAAAALVSNPILLQLGVVSGKRRRRDTEEITGPDFENDFIKTLQQDTGHINTNHLDPKTQTHVVDNNKKSKIKMRSVSKKYSAQNKILQKIHRIRPFENVTPSSIQLVTDDYDEGLVPIPSRTRQNTPS